jgi:hypothetical protein
MQGRSAELPPQRNVTAHTENELLSFKTIDTKMIELNVC